MLTEKPIWTIEAITSKLTEIKAKGFIGIPPEIFRSDEGVVGQILEREFNIKENNLRVSDLGEFELKGMRRKATTLTLCHRTSETGLNPIQVFDRFGYIKASKRDKSVMKKKLFCTVTGKKFNRLGFRLQPEKQSHIDLLYKDEFICRWNLTDAIQKMNKLIVVFANTTGETNSADEKFHYIQGFLYDGLKSINELVTNGKIVIDFCIDQALNSTKGPHDRGPHIRIPKTQLPSAYNEVKVIL